MEENFPSAIACYRGAVVCCTGATAGWCKLMTEADIATWRSTMRNYIHSPSPRSECRPSVKSAGVHREREACLLLTLNERFCFGLSLCGREHTAIRCERV